MATTNIGGIEATLSLKDQFSDALKKATSPISNFTNGLKSIGTVAAGILSANVITGIANGIRAIGSSTVKTVSQMQDMEKQIQSLSASEMVKNSGGMLTYANAIEQAGEKANQTIDYIRKLSIVSPYSNQTVLQAFQMNAAMGQSIDQAKTTTKAILTLGAGMGMTEQEMSGFAMALAQTGATGKITAADLRQFANNRFGLDKMNDVFERLSKNTGVQIKTHDEFNQAIDAGKISVDDFYTALSDYSEQNYGGAVKLMSGTLSGLSSTLEDIRTFAMGDLFKPLGDDFAKAFAPIVNKLGDFLGEGGFKKFGEKIANWAKPGLDAIKQFGDAFSLKRFATAIGSISNYLNGITKTATDLRGALVAAFGESFGLKIAGFIEKFKTPLNWIIQNKDAIVGGLKGIGVAFGALMVVSTIAGILSGIVNPLTIILAIAGALGAAWETNFGGIRDITMNAFSWILTNWESIKASFDGIAFAVAGIFMAIKLGMGPLGWIIAAVGALSVAWDTNFLGMRTAVTGLWEKITEVFSGKSIGEIVKLIGAALLGAVLNLIGFLGGLIDAMVQAVIDSVASIAPGVAEAFSGWWNSIVTYVREVYDGIIQWFTDLWNELVGHSIVPDMIQDVVTAFTGWWDKLKAFVVAIYTGMVEWFINIKNRIGGIAKQIITSVKTGFEEKWKDIMTWGAGLWDAVKGWFSEMDLVQTAKDIVDGFLRGLQEAWSSVTGWVGDKLKGLFGGGDSTEQAAAGTATVEVSNMVAIDAFTGVPQSVLDSFEALNQKILALNLSIPTLNLNLGTDSGLLFILTAVVTYLSGDATIAFTNFATFISLGGVFGLALDTLIKMFSLDGGLGLKQTMMQVAEYMAGDFTTTFTNFATFISLGGVFGLALDTLIKMFSLDGGLGLKQTMMQVAEYMAGDFTTTFTNFATFISLGGTFGDALDKLIKTLSQDGGNGSLKQTMEKVAAYIKEDFTTTFTDFETHLTTKTMPTYEALAKLLYYGTNTVHNAYGNVLGVLESIYQVLDDIVGRLRGPFKKALEDSLDPMGKFEGAGNRVATVCGNIASQATAAAMAIADLIAQMSALDSMDVAIPKAGGDGGGKRPKACAKGGSVSSGMTYLVGERGPELFTPRRSGWVIPNDEVFGNKNLSGSKTINIEIHDIYGDANLEARIRNGVTRGLREAEALGYA